MAEALKTFREGEDILASETNENNQFLLSKLSDNAAQVQNYVEGELATIKSNVSSVQATLQNNLNELDEKMKANFVNIFAAIAPNYSKGKNISSGYKATAAGWVRYRLGSDAGFRQSLAINGVTVAENWQGAGDQRAGTLYITGMVFIATGQTITGSYNQLVFYPCKGFEEVE
jgi:hypothetical protein